MHTMTNKLKSFYTSRIITKSSIYSILAVFCIWHIGYELQVYLRDKKTTITTASFHGEQHQSEETNWLQLPRFALCFSKLFTYNALHTSDAMFLYSYRRSDTSNYSTLPGYSWKAVLDRTITQVKFGSKTMKATDVFESVFYVPSATCWQTKDNFQVFANRAGQVNMLELTVNVAVYDDIMVDIHDESPVVYLYIIPFSGKSKLGDLRNSVAVSPGRLSCIGFQQTKINSQYRNKNDKRQCDSTGNTADICTANHHTTMLREKCAIDVSSAVFSPQAFFLCYSRLENSNHTRCGIESCLYETYRFTKSEGYIKFDKKLSVVNLSDASRTTIVSDIAKAKQLDSQINPWRRKSFLNIATGVDALTNWVADYLKKPTGFRCTTLKSLNSSLVKIDQTKIPKVVHELRRIQININRFVRLGNAIYKDIVVSLFKYASVEPCFQRAVPSITLCGVKNAKPHRCCTNRTIYCNQEQNYCLAYSISDMTKEVQDFGAVLNRILSAVFETLVNLLAEMKEIFGQLDLTAFIELYSTFPDGNYYIALLKDVMKHLDNVKAIVLESHTYSVPFSFDDEQTTVSPWFRNQCERGMKIGARNRHPSTIRDIWSVRNWYSNYAPSTCLDDRKHYHDIFIPEMPPVRKIPSFVDFICRFYHFYLGNAERHFSTEPTYSLTSSRFRYPHKYAVYVLASIFQAYDSSQFFHAGSERIDDALTRSCFRSMGYPSYKTKMANVNTTYASTNIRMSRQDGEPLQTRNYRLTQFLQILKPNIDVCRDAMFRFMNYYKRSVTKIFGPLLEKTRMLRHLMHYQQHLVIRNTKHKIFLINRLERLAQLIHDAIGGSGEEQLAHFLSRKGTILIGEIHIEMAALQLEHDNDRAVYSNHSSILSEIQHRMSKKGAIVDSIFCALMSTTVHAEKSVQKQIVQTLAQCNNQKWKLSNEPHKVAMQIFSNWLVNATAMVQRARRYTRSLLVSKEFLRKNMMIVSLYYESLQVLTNTDALEVTAENLFAHFANAASIYLRLTIFHSLILLCILIELFISLIESFKLK